ncbi:hypothetical protein CW706_06165 [Candidatus Bathyarchaeota archaeon]|nr:MAG: hypothetical protein CW706_06165 [Candidatus Bathyarchaeota archaeon]
MDLSKKRLIGLTIAAFILLYLVAPAFYLLLSGEFTPTAYRIFLRINPLSWSRLLSSMKGLDSQTKGMILQLLSNTPETYWSIAIDTIHETPKPMLEDTIYVLSAVNSEEWHLVREAIKLYLAGYTPFTPSSGELKREYVEPLAISGEEPVLDWRYMVYIFTYRLIHDKTDVCEAVKTICGYVHKYLTYDIKFWHRRSPKTLIRQKRGTCTNFSILFVAMCRVMGIPARLLRDNSISPATHAWSEFYLEGKGWIHVDPTAGFFDYPQAYLLKWGYRYHLVKAFSPLKGWIDVTPSYVADYGVLTGMIRLDGESVVGADVSIYYPENSRVLYTVKTGGDGSFKFTVAEGTYILEASYKGMVKTLTVSAEAGKTVNVEINLK